MSLGPVPTKIFSLLSPYGFFSDHLSNHNVCQWLLSSRFKKSDNCQFDDSKHGLYICPFWLPVGWCMSKPCKIKLMVQYLICLLCSEAKTASSINRSYNSFHA